MNTHKIIDKNVPVTYGTLLQSPAHHGPYALQVCPTGKIIMEMIFIVND